MNSIRLTADKTRWGAVMNAVMNHGGSLKEGDFRTWSRGCELVAKVFVAIYILLIEENAW